jgi:hypothetical protein
MMVAAPDGPVKVSPHQQQTDHDDDQRGADILTLRPQQNVAEDELWKENAVSGVVSGRYSL